MPASLSTNEQANQTLKYPRSAKRPCRSGVDLEEMRDGIRQVGVDKTKFDYRPLFFPHNGRWRMAQVLMISIFGQFSGNGLGYFNTVIFEQLGITSSSQQQGYNLLNSVPSTICVLTAASLTDRMHRRKALVIGTFAVVVTEALETTTRAKGLAASGVIASAMGFINQFAGPIALGDIGYRYIYVFVGWDVFISIMRYFIGLRGVRLSSSSGCTISRTLLKPPKVDMIIVQAGGKAMRKVVDGANI
ncbi:hypothetical protein SCUP515_05485 [Seiridium cupressi]